MWKILIIADEFQNVEAEKISLENYDFNVTVETDAEKGEKAAMSGKYDALILEDRSSGKDNYKICEDYRKTSQAPVIFISKKEKEKDIVRAFQVGADDYIIKKNFNSAELVARVKRRLSCYSSLLLLRTDVLDDDSDDEMIDCGGLVINRTKQRVFVDGVEKMLANKEYEVLLFLASHPFVYFKKDVLFQKIWKKQPSEERNTVVTHINKIREKIERDPKDPKFIESRWGKGYRLNKVR